MCFDTKFFNVLYCQCTGTLFSHLLFKYLFTYLFLLPLLRTVVWGCGGWKVRTSVSGFSRAGFESQCCHVVLVTWSTWPPVSNSLVLCSHVQGLPRYWCGINCTSFADEQSPLCDCRDVCVHDCCTLIWECGSIIFARCHHCFSTASVRVFSRACVRAFGVQIYCVHWFDGCIRPSR